MMLVRSTAAGSESGPVSCTATSKRTVGTTVSSLSQQTGEEFTCKYSSIGRESSPRAQLSSDHEPAKQLSREVQLVKVPQERFGADFAFWDGELYVVHVEKHALTLSGRFSAAFRAGLRVGDRLLNVNGLDACQLGPEASKEILDGCDHVNITYMEAPCAHTYRIPLPRDSLPVRKSTTPSTSPSRRSFFSHARSSDQVTTTTSTHAHNIKSVSTGDLQTDTSDILTTTLGLCLEHDSHTASILAVLPGMPAADFIEAEAIGQRVVSMGGKCTLGCGTASLNKILSDHVHEGNATIDVVVMPSGLVEVVEDAGHECMAQMGMGTLWLRHMIDADYDVSLARSLQARERKSRGPATGSSESKAGSPARWSMHF